jgi:hypothetical protein
VSGVVATRLALRRYRSERSYDARVAWHRELAETVKALSNRSRALRFFFQKDSPAPELPALQEVGELAFRFQELAEQASLYAKKDTYLAIRDIVAELDELSPQFENPPELLPEPEQGEPHPFDISLAGLSVIYDLLARDLRELLGLKKLDDHAHID